MNNTLINEIKDIITNTVGNDVIPKPIADDYPLVGNVLDSLAVTSLIVALEEYYEFVFNDDELSAEAFENPLSLAELVAKKIGK